MHLKEGPLEVRYELTSAEDLQKKEKNRYDLVTCLEMLEHTPDPSSTIAACAKLVKKGGTVIFSTINRNIKSYLFAIIGAEYILKLLPKGTHDYEKLIKPSELAEFCRKANLEISDLIGMTYNPFLKTYALNPDTSVNYIVVAKKQ